MTDIRPIWERSHPVAIAEVERRRLRKRGVI